ncbi:MAG: DUF2461 domain-containing protein [Oscillospiraceae bacterium]|nr:DUF2461 domain-containing protein [Oscillospiraceae bacterium]
MDFDRMLAYCAALEGRNERNWFHENHRWYEDARADFLELVDLLRFRIAELTPEELSTALLYADAKRLVFRIPRDMRMARKAPPYVPSFRAYFHPDRKTVDPVSYFLRLQPGDRSQFGTGAWTMGDRTLLQNVRRYICADPEGFQEALECSGYALSEDVEKLKRGPTGFEAEGEAAELLRYKEWYICQDFPDAALGSFDAFADRIAETVHRMEPFRRVCSHALAGRIPGTFDGPFPGGAGGFAKF